LHLCHYVHASPAHLYMPQLFTHCLPTIICVMLMYVVHLTFSAKNVTTFLHVSCFSEKSSIKVAINFLQLREIILHLYNYSCT